MRPLRKLAIGLWLAVFLFAGIRFGIGWRPAPVDQTGTVNTTVNSGDDTADNFQPPVSVDEKPTAVIPGQALPAIVLKDLKGEPRALAGWSGRTLLINFWATWCAPCRKEMPLLEAFQQAEDPARMQVVGIAIDRLEPVLRFLGETGVTYPNLVGEMDATRAAELFTSDLALPLSVVAAPDGRVLAVHTGELRATDLGQISRVAAGLATGTLSPEAAQAELRLGAAGP